MLTFLVAQKRLISQVDSDLSSVFCYFLLMNYQHLLTSLLTSGYRITRLEKFSTQLTGIIVVVRFKFLKTLKTKQYII